MRAAVDDRLGFGGGRILRMDAGRTGASCPDPGRPFGRGPAAGGGPNGENGAIRGHERRLWPFDLAPCRAAGPRAGFFVGRQSCVLQHQIFTG
jgi:hypothetical protein